MRYFVVRAVDRKSAANSETYNGVEINPAGHRVYVASGSVGAAAAVTPTASPTPTPTPTLSPTPPSPPLQLLQTLHDAAGTDGARAVAVSADGRHVYVAAYVDDAVLAFARDAVSGALTLSDVEREGVDGVSGLFQPFALAVTPDGVHVYVVGPGSHSVVAFARDAASGALQFIAAYEASPFQAPLDSPYSNEGGIAVAPDGAHVYVASRNDSAVSVFARDSATGHLTFVEAQQGKFSLGKGLVGAVSVAVSPDGAQVYVAGQFDGTLAVFDRDASTGALTFVEVHKDGVSGVDGLSGAHAVVVSADGSSVYVGAINDDAVAVFERDAVTGRLTFLERHKDGVGGVEGLDFVRDLALSSDGTQLYATGLSEGALVVFNRNAGTGRLSFLGILRHETSEADTFSFRGGVAASPDGQHIYATDELDNAVAILARDEPQTLPSFSTSLQAAVSGIDVLSKPSAVTLSSDGKYLYANGNHAIGIYSVEDGSGAGGAANSGPLNFLAAYEGGPGNEDFPGVSGLAVSPDGKHLYATMYNGLLAFARDPGTGMLEFLEAYREGENGIDTLGGATGVTVAPAGDRVYVASGGDDALSTFARDPASGRLTFLDAFVDGVDGVEGLDGATAVAVSPDGAHVYVTAVSDDAVVAFARDGEAGTLRFVAAYENGVASSLLDGASSVTVSPDGGYVYAAARFDHAVVQFKRDAATGTLTPWGYVREGSFGVTGLADPIAVTVSPDGDWMFVASYDGAVTVFERIAATAELIFRGVRRNAPGGTAVLRGARAITVASDSQRIYVAAYYDDALSAFAVSSTPLPTSTPSASPTPTATPTPWPTIACGQTIEGVLQPGDPQLFGGDVWTDRYDFSVAEPSSVRFTLTSAAFTPYVWVAVSTSGTALFAGNSPQQGNLDAGLYKVFASNWPTALPAGDYPYQLAMSCGPPGTPTVTPTPTATPTLGPTIACGQTIDGALQPGDPQIFGGDVWTDRYDFTVAETISVRYTLDAEDFTPYLWVATSASGSALFAGSSPQESTLGAGSYKVIASSWPTVLPEGTYPYQLGMTCSAPVTPTPAGTVTPTPAGTVTPTPAGTVTPTAAVTATPTAAVTATPTGTVTAPVAGTVTPTAGVTRTPTAKPTPRCLGDCSDDSVVTVHELLTLINIALGNVPLATCEAGDAGDDGQITIDEILVAVQKAVYGCA